jgi:hypothetical protein
VVSVQQMVLDALRSVARGGPRARNGPALLAAERSLIELRLTDTRREKIIRTQRYQVWINPMLFSQALSYRLVP